MILRREVVMSGALLAAGGAFGIEAGDWEVGVPEASGQLAGAKPLVRHALSRPAIAVAPPGWSYNDALVALIAPILARAQGADLAVLAARDLFDLMGIKRFGGGVTAKGTRWHLLDWHRGPAICSSCRH